MNWRRFSFLATNGWGRQFFFFFSSPASAPVDVLNAGFLWRQFWATRTRNASQQKVSTAPNASKSTVISGNKKNTVAGANRLTVPL